MSYTEDLQSIEVGQRLCVTGSGSDRLAHRHVTVTGRLVMVWPLNRYVDLIPTAARCPTSPTAVPTCT